MSLCAWSTVECATGTANTTAASECATAPADPTVGIIPAPDRISHQVFVFFLSSRF
jgi:hypothetical protein